VSGPACPVCQGSAPVIDTRSTLARVRRRRRCSSCGQIFKTDERIVALGGMVAAAPLSSVLISRLEAPGATRTALARLLHCSPDTIRVLTSPWAQNGGKIHREPAESYAVSLGLNPEELWP
jgi:hypothetical protein